ncbi:ImuA family protein [Gluconobacter oxydans]|uniref:ImuA family protein n=1 Tax=Gluconobacter oxydans TaxID=442 RepID=UPI0039ED37C5
MTHAKMDTLALLRDKIRRIEGFEQTAAGRLSTGIPAIDACLHGGLTRGGLHEFFGAGSDRSLAARPTRFIASILARTDGPVIWASEEHLDLSAAGIRRSGLNLGRLICVTAIKGGLTALCEDVVRERGVCALVADYRTPLSLTESRRLHLAAEKSGVTGFLIFRSAALAAAPPTSASVTRWRVAGTPSPLSDDTASYSPVASSERWAVDLLRHRSGSLGTWLINPADHVQTHSLPVAPALADRALAQAPRSIQASDRAGALRA